MEIVPTTNEINPNGSASCYMCQSSLIENEPTIPRRDTGSFVQFVFVRMFSTRSPGSHVSPRVGRDNAESHNAQNTVM